MMAARGRLCHRRRHLPPAIAIGGRSGGMWYVPRSQPATIHHHDHMSSWSGAPSQVSFEQHPAMIICLSREHSFKQLDRTSRPTFLPYLGSSYDRKRDFLFLSFRPATVAQARLLFRLCPCWHSLTFFCQR